MIIIKKTLILLCFFFLFNTLEVDSNSDKYIFFDISNKYSESTFNVYFKDKNSKRISNIIDGMNIEIICFIIDNKKYYYDSVNTLEEEYLKNLSLNEKIYYESFGFDIDGMIVHTQIYKIHYLQNVIDIY